MANKSLTVEQLYVACGMLIKKGKGKRHILVTNDDECNGYHELFFGFSPIESPDRQGIEQMLPYGVTPEEAEKEYITLG